MKTLKVFGVGSYRSGVGQTREIVAARSMTAAAKLVGVSYRQMKDYGSETGNKEECELALSEPGEVFYHALDCKAWSKGAYRHGARS